MHLIKIIKSKYLLIITTHCFILRKRSLFVIPFTPRESEFFLIKKWMQNLQRDIALE